MVSITVTECCISLQLTLKCVYVDWFLLSLQPRETTVKWQKVCISICFNLERPSLNLVKCMEILLWWCYFRTFELYSHFKSGFFFWKCAYFPLPIMKLELWKCGSCLVHQDQFPHRQLARHNSLGLLPVPKIQLKIRRYEDITKIDAESQAVLDSFVKCEFQRCF
jgi:hypothetical protein